MHSAPKQQKDKTLLPLFARVGKVQGGGAAEEEFILLEGVLQRQWCDVMSNENGVGEVVQVVVPSDYKEALVQLAHEGPSAGMLGVRKTALRLQQNFWWPSTTARVASYIRGVMFAKWFGNQTKPYL